MFRSLRWRMAFSHGAVMAVILLVLGGTGQILLARSLDAAATRDALDAAHQEVDRLVEAGTPSNPPDSDSPARSATRVAVFLPSGRPVSEDERIPVWLKPLGPPVVDMTALGQPVRIVTLSARSHGRLVATVVAGRSLVEEQSLMHRVRLLLVFGGIAAAVASMAAGWWLAGRAARPVRRAYAAQANFAADASHELRTPLAFVRSGIEVLAEQDADLGTEVLEEIDYLTSLTDRLLLLARADSGSIGLHPELLDVEEVCVEAARRARGAHGLHLSIQGSASSVARTDRVSTEAALDALLENVAVHGGGRASLRWDMDGRWVHIVVQDHGPGLPPGAAEVAFERFFRADSARVRGDGGAGLGLSIAEALVRVQGGRILLADTPGGGLTATIELPSAAQGAAWDGGPTALSPGCGVWFDGPQGPTRSREAP